MKFIQLVVHGMDAQMLNFYDPWVINIEYHILLRLFPMILQNINGIMHTII